MCQGDAWFRHSVENIISLNVNLNYFSKTLTEQYKNF